MKYKVIFNLPGKDATTILVDESKMEMLMQAVNEKKVVQINQNYYNTAYFVQAEQDRNTIKLSDEQRKQIEATKNKYTNKQIEA